MKKITFAFLLLAFVVPFFAVAQRETVSVSKGFADGNTYRTLNQNEKRWYAAGFVNGVLASKFVGIPKENLAWFEDYVRRMTSDQIVAIIDKYIDDHPGRWHEPLNGISYNALRAGYIDAHPPEH